MTIATTSFNLLQAACLRPSTLTCALILASVTSVPLSGQRITNPLPEPIPESTKGILLDPWVQIPPSPVNALAPRLNFMTQTEDGRFWVNDQRGYLWVFDTGEPQPRLYLNLFQQYPAFDWITSDAWQTGFTYFAFHPEFASNGVFYTVVSVRATTGTPSFAGKRPIPGNPGTVNPSHHDVLLRWQADDPMADIFAGSITEVMRIEQPYSDHNIGEIAFNPLSRQGDPDYGLLYMATGDGGWIFRQVSPDPQRVAQDLSSPLGKILRIDPEGSNAASGNHGIPAKNPFVGHDGALAEIYAFGLRNPHRISWDHVTGNLFAFDIGGDYIEEVNLIVAGGNYGWSLREGTWAHEEGLLYPLPDADEAAFIYPVAQYGHAFSNGAITGGFVYRGNAMRSLTGHLIFADFTSMGLAFHTSVQNLSALEPRQTLPLQHLQIFNSDGELSSLNRVIRGQDGQRTDARFATDLKNELYLLNKHNGWIYIDFSALPYAWFSNWNEWARLY